VPAHADTLAPDAVNQDFTGSQGGWTQSAQYSGLCLQPLACPAAVNTWSGGGADGGGYIRTQFSSLAETLAGTSTGIWQSPAFTYDGADGQVPASVTFDMNTFKDISALLGVALSNDSSFEVDLVDQSGGNGVTLVPATPLLANSGWTAIPTTSVNPSLLKLGHAYKIQITTTYHAAASLQAAGEVGYDNVRLTTVAGAGVKPSNGGSGITDIRQLRKLTKSYILPKTASVRGKVLVVHLRCPAVADPKPCQLQVAGLQKGKFSQPATARKVLRLKAGKERTVRIRIKPNYLASYTSAKKIWVKTIVRVGKVRVTVRTRMKLT
jgi:hypothetical protein